MKEKFILVIFSLALLGCSSVSSPSYQGNFFSEDLLDKLKVGMKKHKVVLYFGQPLIRDVFHGDNRWDYVEIKRDALGVSQDLPIQFIQSEYDSQLAKNDSHYNDFVGQLDGQDDPVAGEVEVQRSQHLVTKLRRLSLFFEGDRLKTAIYNGSVLF